MLLDEFVGFSFKGTHSSELNIKRISDGSRLPSFGFNSITDSTETVIDRDGEYYFGTTIGSKEFTLQFATDGMTELQLSKFIKLFEGRDHGLLSLDEQPYKSYWAKISSPPTFEYIPYEEKINGIRQNLYKGEGFLTFVAYEPFAKCTNPFLETYYDVNNKIYSNDNNPPWNGSGQLLPKGEYNTYKPAAIRTKYDFYVGGFDSYPLDIVVKFNSSVTNAGRSAGVVSQMQQNLDTVSADYSLLQSQVLLQEQKISNINNQLGGETTTQSLKDSQLNHARYESSLLITATSTLKKANEDLIKDNQTSEKEIALLVDYIKKQEASVKVMKTALSELNKHLNLTPEKQQEKDFLELRVAAETTNITNSKTQITNYNISINNNTATFASNTNKINSNIAQITLYEKEILKLVGELVVIEEKITQLNSSLSYETNILNSVIREFNSKKTERNNLQQGIINVQATGMNLTGNTIAFTRQAQTINGKFYPKKECRVQAANDLRNKTLYIKGSNGEVCFYDAAGIRYEYFNYFRGEFLDYYPTGIIAMENCLFNAGGTTSNRITIDRKISAVEQSQWLGKTISFWDNFANVGRTAVINNIQYVGNTTILTLSTTYSLLNGMKNIYVLNKFLEFNVSDTRFIESIEFVMPYIYY